MNKPPPISPEILKYLDEQFPERCPDPALKSREIWIRSGERRLVRHLHRIAKEQAERPLENAINPKNPGSGNAPSSR